MTLQAINDQSKCAGQSSAGSHICADRNRCGRYLRPGGDRQVHSDFWKAGRDCQHYESVPSEHHIVDEQPAKLEW
jgi:hypothetical protein